MSEARTLSYSKRAAILGGAARSFAKDGYDGASMAQIAAVAGVSKGTLYNHFDSKAALFAAWVQDACAQNLAEVFGSLDRDAAPEAALRDLGLRLLRMLLSPTGLTIERVVSAEGEAFPELAHTFWEAGPARGLAALSGYLSRQHELGRLTVADPAFAAEQFGMLCQGKLVMRRRLHLMGQPTETEMARVVDAAVAMFLRTYAVTPEAG